MADAAVRSVMKEIVSTTAFVGVLLASRVACRRSFPSANPNTKYHHSLQVRVLLIALVALAIALVFVPFALLGSEAPPYAIATLNVATAMSHSAPFLYPMGRRPS